MRRNTDEELRDLERRLRSGDQDAMIPYGRRLVRLGRATEDQAQLLDGMGPEAWLAWGSGGEYEWQPDSVEFGERYAEFIEPRDRDVPDDEDPHGDGTWTSGWSVEGLAVRQRGGSPVIVHTYWVVDSSGNWDSLDDGTWPIGSPHDELDIASRRRDDIRSWSRTYAWIAGTHRDPIGDLLFATRRGPSAEWRFTLEQRMTRGRSAVVVTKAARLRNRRWVAASLRRLPESLWQWLSVEAPVDDLPFLVTTIGDLDVVRENNKVVKDDGRSVVIETVIEGQIIPPTDRQMRDAARAQEVRAGERLMEAEREVQRLSVLAQRCVFCNAEIQQEEGGAWVDVTGGDACDDGVHRPATEQERLLGRDRPEDMERGDTFECDRCGGTFSDVESHSTPEGQVICDACFEAD